MDVVTQAVYEQLEWFGYTKDEIDDAMKNVSVDKHNINVIIDCIEERRQKAGPRAFSKAAAADDEKARQLEKQTVAQTEAEPRAFKIGDECELYSSSKKEWYAARIIDEIISVQQGKHFVVQYRIGPNYYKKQVSAESKRLRSLDVSQNEHRRDTKCICGETMVWTVARNCYGGGGRTANKKGENEGGDDTNTWAAMMDGDVNGDVDGDVDDDVDDDEGKEEEIDLGNAQPMATNATNTTNATKTDVSCDGCGYKFSADEQLWHCPRGRIPIHSYGSDLCYKCTNYDDDGKGVQNIIPKEKDENGRTIAHQLGHEPFAEGSARYAYLGLWDVGPKKGMRCVVKRYKDKHLFLSDGYDGDIKCAKLARELIEKWNQMKLVNKNYDIIVPIIARKSGKSWEMKMEMIILLRMSGLKMSSPMIQKLLNSTDEGKEDENRIQSGEVVMIEDYLKGEFFKWNSNSGWVGDDTNTVQAFCHWTYHYSEGKYLFCDAQGVKRPNQYILTDPAILSNTEKGGVYGVTDCGRLYLLNWFRTHSCNKFCDKAWKKPMQLELDSVPQKVRKSITRSSTYNGSKLMKSAKLNGDGSVTQTTFMVNGEAIDENHEGLYGDEEKDARKHSYENEAWYKYDKFISTYNNERIIFCSEVTHNNSKRVLILSSFEKLYLINPESTALHDDDQEEFSKKQVKNVDVVDNDKKKMILKVKGGTFWLTITDPDIEAKDW
eukprot:CAMPEP_0202695782 /NCGR_PEP_ID=MMETSP1385-20130828/9281_1 /ASSEMBLY_ACC=CAM_ASM_000861 /TAXON_ID=933848 /ORGANISM="Elphidium margaritaceum" /LENGTH=718 /DNA_ID=CAMNT_0049351859 /DNA_START=32 /DNA_END=2185 /DNA_ORIENTATION=+